jgi:hypothetical protein
MLPANLALAFPQPLGTNSALTGVKLSQFLSEDMLVFAGKINTFDDFHQPLTGAGGTNGFMNTALMINPVVVRTVPYSTFGAGFAMLQHMEPVFSMAVFDTNDNPTTSGFDTFFDDGVSIVSSLNLPTDWMALPGHQESPELTAPELTRTCRQAFTISQARALSSFRLPKKVHGRWVTILIRPSMWRRTTQRSDGVSSERLASPMTIQVLFIGLQAPVWLARAPSLAVLRTHLVQDTITPV